MRGPRRVKISAVDTAWLRMDRPQNLMMICGVLLFREKLSLARLRKVIAERFVVFKRFRQRPVEMPGVAFWENDPHFDVAHHVVRAPLPGRGGSSTSSTTRAAARWSRASITATPTASRSCA